MYLLLLLLLLFILSCLLWLMTPPKYDHKIFQKFKHRLFSLQDLTFDIFQFYVCTSTRYYRYTYVEYKHDETMIWHDVSRVNRKKGIYCKKKHHFLEKEWRYQSILHYWDCNEEIIHNTQTVQFKYQYSYWIDTKFERVTLFN